MDFFLEIIGHIGFISSVIISFCFDIIEDDVVFFLVNGLQFVLQPLFVWIGIFRYVYDTIFLDLLCIRGGDLR